MQFVKSFTGVHIQMLKKSVTRLKLSFRPQVLFNINQKFIEHMLKYKLRIASGLWPIWVKTLAATK